MPPTPTPTAEQIESVREIAQLYSYPQSESLIAVLNEAQWAASLLDLAAWTAIKNKHTRIEGDGVNIDKDRNRLDITIRLRRRLGVFPAQPSDESNASAYCSYTPKTDDADCCLFE